MGSGSDGRRVAAASVAVTALLVLALVAPSVALLLAWSRTDEAVPAADRDTRYALSASARTVTVGATASPTWGEAPVVRSPVWSGVVTEVLVAPGSPVDDGTPVVRVDGVEIRYFTVGSPLYQPVCQGDDVLVAEVRAVLTTTGLRTGTSRRLSAVDLVSVRAYAAAIGVVGARTATCFDPGWVLVGAEPLGAVASVGLAVGEPAPAQGEVVLTGQMPLESVTLSGSAGAASIDDRLTVEGATVFAGTELMVSGRALGVGVADIAAAPGLAALATALTGATDAGDGAKGSTDTSDGSSSTSVAVVLTLRESQFVVPATAVVSPLGDQACVVVEGTAVPVSVIASSVSGLVIDLGSRTVPDEISLEPGDVRCA